MDDGEDKRSLPAALEMTGFGVGEKKQISPLRCEMTAKRTGKGKAKATTTANATASNSNSKCGDSSRCSE
jgi:hypothetical protein